MERRKTARGRGKLSARGEDVAMPAAELMAQPVEEHGAGGRVVKVGGEERRLNARPDPLDFRDRMYEATLVEVPPHSDLDAYRARKVPVLDQGSEGACTGAALATVAHYLLRSRRVGPSEARVSIRMLYEMAKRYDEWEGTDYSGSSARGAMKGWHKHGVCLDDHWKYAPGQPDRVLNDLRARDAASRPLGSYYRVNHTDLVAMHAAITEVGVLYATACVHEGWLTPNADGTIPYDSNKRPLGGHAFVLVGYDHDGFWLQNSWDTKWGAGGLAHITYDDWLANGTDVWVARLGAAVTLSEAASTVFLKLRSATAESYTQEDLRPHIVSVGNNGEFRIGGRYGTTAADVAQIFDNDFPRITANWARKRILIYAHGGLSSEEGALERIADYRRVLLESEVYPLAFIWKTDYWSTLKNMLDDASMKRRPEGFVSGTKDFLLDRADDMLEPLARVATGKGEWSEMKENAMRSTVRTTGAARTVVQHLAQLHEKNVEIHIVAHSAGAVLHAPIVQLLSTTGAIAHDLGGFSETLRGQAGLGVPIESCTLWAPACTTKLFHDAYVPALNSGAIRSLAIFTLTDDAEQDDDCARVYNKSLLYLVSNAFEARFRIPLLRPDGEPITGMEKFLTKDAMLKALITAGRIDHVRAPNTNAPGTPRASTATTHGGFDDDIPTVRATLARVLGAKAPAMTQFLPSSQSQKDQRRMLLKS